MEVFVLYLYKNSIYLENNYEHKQWRFLVLFCLENLESLTLALQKGFNLSEHSVVTVKWRQ